MQITQINPELLPKDNRLLPSEAEEQAALFGWAQMESYSRPELGLLFHIPNGGKRNKSEGARFKAEGVKPGVPDICLPVARGGKHGMYIELKRLRGGTASEEQKQWLSALRAQGYHAVLCRGWREAAEEIRRYLDE